MTRTNNKQTIEVVTITDQRRAEINDHQLLAKLYNIMKEQMDAKIDVRVIEEDKLAAGLRKDLAIFDQSIYSLTILSRSGGTVGTEVSWDEPIVKKALAEFALTREKADQLESFMTRYPALQAEIAK